MKKINNIFNVIIKSLYYSLVRFVVFYAFGILIFNIKCNYSMLLLFTLLIHAAVFTICTFFDKNIILDLSSRIKYIILFGIGIGGMLVGSLGMSFFSYVFTFMYFIIISILSVKNGISPVSSSVEAFKTIILVFIFASVFAADKTIVAFNNRAIDFILIYFVTGFIYLLSNNFTKYYEENNSVNKKRNLIILNSISTTIMLTLVFMKDKIIILLQNINQSLSVYTDKLLNNIANGLNYLAETILNDKFKAFVDYFIKARKEGGIAPEEDAIEKATEATKELMELEGGAFDFSILYNIVFIIFAILFITILIVGLKHFKGKKNKKSHNVEKEFIFKKEDILKDIKDSIKSIFKKREILSPERKMYKNAVNELIKEGYEYSESATPNEYVKTVNKKDIEKRDFDVLTNKYNKCRYGKYK